jgi:uncharacterized protein involved in exopolysaccharide biosynthesis
MTAAPRVEGAIVLDLRAALRSVRPKVGPLLLVAVVVMISVAAWTLLTPRRYGARMVLSAVGPAQTNLGAAASSFLLESPFRLGGAGIQATPALVSYLLTSETILDGVARQPFGNATISDALFGAPTTELGRATVVRRMRSRVKVLLARQTDLITLTVTLGDSVLARAVATGIVADAQALFARVTTAQAGQFRRAQEARVDSAHAELTVAENALLRFTVGNRIVQAGSRLALERDRLERAVAAVQQAYLAAIADREAAHARELAQTPALAIVEAIPVVLPREEPRTAMRSILAGVAFLVLAALALVLRALWADGNANRT